MADGDFVFKSPLEDLDINSKLDIINSFVNDIESHTQNVILTKSLKYLHEILEKINSEIENIKKEIELPNKNIFTTDEVLDHKDTLEKLKLHIKILDDRFNSIN